MSTDDKDLKRKLKTLREAQMERLPAAARQATEQPEDHEQLVELIKVYTAIKAIDFAMKHYDDEA